MQLRNCLRAALASTLLAAVGCSAAPAESEHDMQTHGGPQALEETCTATFRQLQKDAYKNTAGRTSELWPAHTTTTLDVVCTSADGTTENVASVFQANHGTKPGAVDANGDVFLVEVSHTEVTGSRADLLDLVGQYQACSCEEATTFLSLDSVQNKNEMVGNLIDYLDLHLQCDLPDGVTTLTNDLRSGDIQAAIDDFSSCYWDDGTDLEQAFQNALFTIALGEDKTLDDFHVCNNDAELQAGLIDSFANDGYVSACDPQTDVCHGPKFFYSP